MSPADWSVARVILGDPARRRRLIRRAAQAAVRRRMLHGTYVYRVEGTAVVASMDGIDLARVDAFDGEVIHD